MSKGILIAFILVATIVVALCLAPKPLQDKYNIIKETMICESTELWGCGRSSFVNEDGDIMTGNLNFTQDNQPYFNVSKTIDIPVSSFKLPAVDPAREDIINVFPVLRFDADKNESTYSTMHAPENYYENTDWSFIIYWSPETDTPGDVLWCVETVGLTANTDDKLNNETTTKCILDSAEQNDYELLKTGKLTFNGIKTLINDQFGFRVFRGADDPSDTYAPDAMLVDTEIYYQINKIGGSS